MREMARRAREERHGIRSTLVDKEEAQREELRRERQNERRRERNIARAAPDKQAKLRNDKDRDISEKIALGECRRVHRNDLGVRGEATQECSRTNLELHSLSLCCRSRQSKGEGRRSTV